MRIARSDVHSFSGSGGCKGHRRGPKEARLVVDCPPCEEFLAKDPMWAGSLEDVPLTPDEQKEAVRREKEAQLVTAEFANAVATKAKETVLEDRRRRRPSARA